MTDRHSELRLRFRPALADDWGLSADAVGEVPVMITAVQAAQARTATAARLLTRPGWRMDPVNYRLDPSLRWTTGKKGTKRSYQVLNREYSSGLPAPLLGAPISWRARPQHEVRRFVGNVLGFELDFLLSETRAAVRLFTLDQLAFVDQGLAPAGLLSPYVLISGNEDVLDQASVWANTPADLEGLPVEYVIALTQRALMDPGVLRRVDDACRTLPARPLWFWFVGERHRLSPATISSHLRAERSAISNASRHHEVQLLHAGFFELALAYDGVVEATVGPGMYSPGPLGGGGLELALFYSSVMHRKIWYAEARNIAARSRNVAELGRELCACEMCAEAFEMSPASYVTLFFSGRPMMRNGRQIPNQELASALSAQINRFHRVFVRGREIDEIRRTERLALASRLASVVLTRRRSDVEVLHGVASVLRAGA